MAHSLFWTLCVSLCYAVARGLFSHSFSSATSSLPLPTLSGPMSRWLFPWSGSIKKRACRYLLQHYLGHFLQERLSLDQLGLDLYNGSGVIKEINLDVWVSVDEESREWLLTSHHYSNSHWVFLSDPCTLDCFATALEFNNNLQRHALSLARISSWNCTHRKHIARPPDKLYLSQVLLWIDIFHLI